MPNWNNTSLIVEGEPAEVERFIAGIKDKKIIETYYPCPDDLNILSGHMAEDNPEYPQWVAKTEENIVKYGVPNWYEWQYEYWGTKWGDVRTEIDEPFTMDNGVAQSLIQFETAWGPADGAWMHISKLFPTLTFEFYYTEEAGFFEGYHVARNGEWIFDAQFIPVDNPFDCDEQEDEYTKWEEQERGKIETAWMEWKKA